MAGYKSTQIRMPADEKEFESNCRILFSEILGDPGVQRVGRRGVRQYGCDSIGRRQQDATQLVGIQSKLKGEGRKLTAHEVRREVAKALKYEPPLAEYYIVTSAPDETGLQQLAVELMQREATVGRKILIQVWGRNTLEERINEHEAAKNAFDPGFSPSISAQTEKIDTLVKGQKGLATRGQVAEIARAVDSLASPMAGRLPASYADHELKERLSRILRRRGFHESNIATELNALADAAIDGELVLGSTTLRAEVVQKAARANAEPPSIAVARRYRLAVLQIDPNADLTLLDALIAEAAGDTDSALRVLRQRSDPEFQTAIFSILVRTTGAARALEWLRSQPLTAGDLTAPGTLNVFIKLIDERRFQEATAWVDSIKPTYFDDCPALRLLRAHLMIASILPTDQRDTIFKGLPINPRMLDLASDAASRAKLARARDDVRTLQSLVGELQLGGLGDFLSELDLWLRLEHVETNTSARQQLQQEITDPSKTLRRVRLALSYDVPFNHDALRRHLRMQRELGGWTDDERFAAFLLEYYSRDAVRLATFFDEYREELFSKSELDQGALAGLEIQAIANAGRFEDARLRLKAYTGSYLNPEHAERIAQLVRDAESGDEAEGHRRRYEAAGDLVDLRLLVGALVAKHDNRRLANYAPLLARETRNIEDFGLAVRAMFRDRRYDELFRLLAGC